MKSPLKSRAGHPNNPQKEVVMHFWEYVYFGVILYCLPLLWLAFTLTLGRNVEFVHQLPKWWQIVGGLGVLQLVLLSATGVIPLLLMPLWLLCSIGAPTSAGVIGSIAITLSYGAIAFAMVPLERTRATP